MARNNMKSVLIISPHFPPINAADMHRVRMSLPYFEKFNWKAHIVTVDLKFVEGFYDEILNHSIPKGTIITYVKALNQKWTRKLGLGSLSIRALPYYFIAVNQILKKEKFDIIFFSTTMFHVGLLGAYWKRRFKIPLVFDLQDPWCNDYYLSKPKAERPKKFYFSYLLLKWTENIGLPKADGIIAVSNAYLTDAENRYPNLKSIPKILIPFGFSPIDFNLASVGLSYPLKVGKINVVYIGAITPGFIPIITAFFQALLNQDFEFEKYHFYFLGTSYTKLYSKGLIQQLVEDLGLAKFVTEQQDRLGYFSSLATLKKADILFLPGSIDVNYNASKVYNAIASRTPIFSIFSSISEVKKIVELSNAGEVISFANEEELKRRLTLELDKFLNILEKSFDYDIPLGITAESRAEEITNFFDFVINSN
jgi:hypothetical protein